MGNRWGNSGNRGKFYFWGAPKSLRRRQWHPTPVLLPGESHGRRSLVGCYLWGRTELDVTDATAAAAKSLQMVTAAMKLKDAFSLEGKL